MSYDIRLRCPTCQQRPEDLNPTYNLTAIFNLALTGEDLPNPEVSEAAVVILGAPTDRPRGLRLLNGKKAADTLEWLNKALVNLRNPDLRDRFEALEPDNGWGTIAGAARTIEEMIGQAIDLPNNVWEIG